MAPIWLTLLGWNGAYATAGTVMVQQAALCDTTLGSLRVPPASMFLCATVTLLTLVPLYERVVLPALAKRGSRPPSMLFRTGAACAAIALSQFIAAGVEAARLSADAAGHRFSVVWLIPQYVLVGVAEFFYVGAIEFYYAQAPPCVRALASALLLSAFGVANLLSGGVIKAVHLATDWMPTATVGGAAAAAASANGRLDLYFTCVGVASLANLALFVWPVAARYTPYTPPEEEDDWSDDGREGGRRASDHASTHAPPTDLKRDSPLALALPLSTARVVDAAWSASSREGSLHGGRSFFGGGSRDSSHHGGFAFGATPRGQAATGWRATVHGGAAALSALRRGRSGGGSSATTTPRGVGGGPRSSLARASSAPNVIALDGSIQALLVPRGVLASDDWAGGCEVLGGE